MTDKPKFTVEYKKKPKIPKELLIYFTPETKVQIAPPGNALGLPASITAKPHPSKNTKTE